MIYAGFYTEILSCNPLHPIKLTMVSEQLNILTVENKSNILPCNIFDSSLNQSGDSHYFHL